MNVSAVLAELKRERTRLDQAIEALEGLEKSNGARRSVGGKRMMSAEGRRLIAAAQRKRWAKWKKEQRG